MNPDAQQKIIALLDAQRADYLILRHNPCRSSEESALARAQAGGPGAIGGKAILVAVEGPAAGPALKTFTVLVLPGTHKLDSKAIRTCFPDLKKFRFATAEEMSLVCGVMPGAMPPFGASIFPGISKLLIDESLMLHEWMGFNAAEFTTSIVVKTEHYMRAVAPEAIIANFALPSPPAVAAEGGQRENTGEKTSQEGYTERTAS